jgi:hypothetical protein
MASESSRLRFERLPHALAADIVALNTDPRVLRHMPLAHEPFAIDGCAEWVAGKDANWQLHGYGPMAVYIDGEFAGWGGLQNEGGDADLALVLRPKFWGWGAVVFAAIVEDAVARNPKLGSITVMLPIGRRGAGVAKRMGWEPDGTVDYDGTVFERFRMRLDA